MFFWSSLLWNISIVFFIFCEVDIFEEYCLLSFYLIEHFSLRIFFSSFFLCFLLSKLYVPGQKNQVSMFPPMVPDLEVHEVHLPFVNYDVWAHVWSKCFFPPWTNWSVERYFNTMQMSFSSVKFHSGILPEPIFTLLWWLYSDFPTY